MKKILITSSLIIITLIAFNLMNMNTLLNVLATPFTKNKIEARPDNGGNATQSFYDFKIKALSGKEVIDFSQYKGKKVIILNVASKCGYTPQYADWEKFYEKNKDKFVVLGCPANDFMEQEPGSNDEIATFCQKNYGVTFQLFDKMHVVGAEKHPLYKWLSDKKLNGWNDKEPSWNFCKYLINEKGELTHFFASGVKPTDKEFLAAIQ